MQAPEILVNDLLVPLQAGPKPNDEVMEARRTSCARLPVWEDAADFGLVQRERDLVVPKDAGKDRMATRS